MVNINHIDVYFDRPEDESKHQIQLAQIVGGWTGSVVSFEDVDLYRKNIISSELSVLTKFAKEFYPLLAYADMLIQINDVGLAYLKNNIADLMEFYSDAERGDIDSFLAVLSHEKKEKLYLV